LQHNLSKVITQTGLYHSKQLETIFCIHYVKNRCISPLKSNATMLTASWYTQAHTTVLQPLHRSTCVSWYPQFAAGRFCWTKIVLPTCTSCWW